MKISAVILAAGKGTRFGEKKINKTAVVINNKSIVQIGIDQISDLVDDMYVVVGHKKDSVIKSITTKDVKFPIQTKRLGTGHAVKVALKAIESNHQKPSHVFVANGDHLFSIKKHVIKQLIKEHLKGDNDVTILTIISNNPKKYDNGRIVRKDGKIVKILEKTDFKNSDRLIKELNTGTYVFKYDALQKAFKILKSEKGKEIYITNIPFLLKKIDSYSTEFDNVGSGINTKLDLTNHVLR